MKIFNTLKRKVGNAVLPVVGTILGLTILAGSIVGVALNSSKIVYRNSNLQKQNDARQILYIAANYFCDAINSKDEATKKTPKQAKDYLISVFELLAITKNDKPFDDEEVEYYLYYPVNCKDGTDGYLKATVRMTPTDGDEDDPDAEGNSKGEVNMTLFPEEDSLERNKIDEKFNIANMLAVYLKDQDLYSGTSDGFDDAFMSQMGTSEIVLDSVTVKLCGYSWNGDHMYDSPVKIYETGLMGGHYTVLEASSDGLSTYYKDFYTYCQKYDNTLLKKVIEYYDGDEKRTVNIEKITDTYSPETERHVISFEYIGDTSTKYYFYNSGVRTNEISITTSQLATKFYNYLSGDSGEPSEYDSITFSTIANSSYKGQIESYFSTMYYNEYVKSSSSYTYNKWQDGSPSCTWGNDWNPILSIQGGVVGRNKINGNGSQWNWVGQVQKNVSFEELKAKYCELAGIEVPVKGSYLKPDTTFFDVFGFTNEAERKSRAEMMLSKMVEYFVSNDLNKILNLKKPGTTDEYLSFEDGITFSLRQGCFENINNGCCRLKIDIRVFDKDGINLFDGNKNGTTNKTVYFYCQFYDKSGNRCDTGNNINSFLYSAYPLTTVHYETVSTKNLGKVTKTINGANYYDTDNVELAKNVTTENIYYDGDLTLTSGTITVANGKNLYINGNLTIKDDADLHLGDDCTLTINGNLQSSPKCKSASSLMAI